MNWIELIDYFSRDTKTVCWLQPAAVHMAIKMNYTTCFAGAAGMSNEHGWFQFRPNWEVKGAQALSKLLKDEHLDCRFPYPRLNPRNWVHCISYVFNHITNIFHHIFAQPKLFSICCKFCVVVTLHYIKTFIYCDLQ